MRKSDRQQNLGKVIIPIGLNSPPEPHEIDAAQILAQYFRCDVEFLVPVDDYLRKSADILIQGVAWEIKSPTGGSKATIQNQFRRASKQAKNIILDTRRSKLDYETIEKRVMLEVKRSSFKKVLLINKFEKVIVIRK